METYKSGPNSEDDKAHCDICDCEVPCVALFAEHWCCLGCIKEVENAILDALSTPEHD